MAQSSRPVEYYIDSKWDTAVDLTIRRVIYGSLFGGAAALLLFRECCIQALHAFVSLLEA